MFTLPHTLVVVCVSFVVVCCLLFVVVVVRFCCSFCCWFFVRCTYLRIQARMHIFRKKVKNVKNEFLQLRDGREITQDEKCCTEMGLNFLGVPGKYVLRPKHFSFRILVPMSMLSVLKAAQQLPKRGQNGTKRDPKSTKTGQGLSKRTPCGKVLIFDAKSVG